MSDSSAHNQGWQIAEVVFGIPLLIAIALDFFRPLTLTQGWLSTLLLVMGGILMLAGVGCVYYARRELALYDQSAEPGKPTTQLVISGIYAFSRNPLYLGGVLIVLGLGLVLNSWWVLISLLPALVGCHVILIFPEERYLAEKLGDDYLAYQRSVNRWLGRKRIQK